MKRALILALVLLVSGAQATELHRYATPAEIARGAVFADRFESQALVESNGGTVTGAPTFSPVTGMTLDGAADYATYNLTGQEFNSAEISIVIVFTPDQAWDAAGYDEYLFDADVGGVGRYYVLKNSPTYSSVFSIILGNTSIADIASGVWSGAWLQNQRNVLVISSNATTDLTNAWLNTTQIITNDATAWTQTAPDTIHIGSRFSGTDPIDGTIHSIQVYHAQLTAAEAQDFHDHSTYTWENQATAHYQFRLQDHDATNTTTIDSTGKAGDLTLVHAPVKQTAHGYDFDGTNDYLTGAISTSVFNSDPLSAVVEFTPHFECDDPGDQWLFNASDGYGSAGAEFKFYHYGTSDRFDITWSETYIGNITEATACPYWRTNQRNVLIISSTSGDTDVYLNGALIMDSDNTAWSAAASTTNLVIAADNGSNNKVDGVIHSFLVAPIMFTHLQALDIDHTIRQRGNQP